MTTSTTAYTILKSVRETNPLIHNITNYVVMNWTANCLLAVGASPLMSHAIEEQEDMTRICNALVINIGTLDAPWVKGMKAAIDCAHQNQKPIVFDPVGVGASKYRTQTCRALLDLAPPTVIRGNASEIMALAGASQNSKGVDSLAASEAALEAAKVLAEKFQCVVCVSGEVDYIISAEGLARVQNGHHIMTHITGMGCAATALIAAFVAVTPHSLHGAVTSAMVVTGVAAELALAHSQGPGTFQAHYLDTLYNLSEPSLIHTQRLSHDAF